MKIDKGHDLFRSRINIEDQEISIITSKVSCRGYMFLLLVKMILKYICFYVTSIGATKSIFLIECIDEHQLSNILPSVLQHL